MFKDLQFISIKSYDSETTDLLLITLKYLHMHD